MDKYEKLFKALELCAGPECCTECPYYGEYKGGKTCRAQLLHDASVALVIEEAGRQGAELERDALRDEVAALAEETDRPAEPKKPEPGLAEAMECALKATADAQYWRGRAEALEWCMHLAVELPEEPGADANV